MMQSNNTTGFAMETAPSHDDLYDDDGRPKRTGTWITGSAHIITAVIGSGVLSLAWAMAQLGWIAGPVALFVFSFITWYASILLADCYRSPDPIYGKRNYSYVDAVKANLGGYRVVLCAIAQRGNLVGTSIGYTITTALSMTAIKRSHCVYKTGPNTDCRTENNPFMIIFGVIQIFLSQIPNFHKLSVLSLVAAVMSFGYSSIGLGLAIAKVAEKGHVKTSLTGIPVGGKVTEMDKMWRTCQALGNIAFAYTYSNVLVEIQDTLKSSPPENKTMKRATLVGVTVSSLFYMLCGFTGYAAFGNDAPGNFLTGFDHPIWLVDVANIAIVIHLIGAYQVFTQPIFRVVEDACAMRWPHSNFVTKEYMINSGMNFSFNPLRFFWRTAYVSFSTVIAMLFPFFNDILGIIGACAFFPLTVFLPVEMYIAHAKIPRFSFKWTWLKVLSFACLVVSILAVLGSFQGLSHSLKSFKPFHSVS